MATSGLRSSEEIVSPSLVYNGFVLNQVSLQEKRISPALKWAGGKRWLVPHLQKFWDPYRNSRLVEPFCGGLAVALGLLPQNALLNDVNEHLVNFYKWIQKGLTIKDELLNQKTFYYRQRKRFNELIANGGYASKKTAIIFYFLNRTGYNGLCRFNNSGEFNVPFGRYKTINYLYDFRQYKKVLKNWKFQTGSYEQIKLLSDDFVYADPPYDVEFRQYSRNGFDWRDQINLAEWLTQHKGPVVLSNQATPRIIDLYSQLKFELEFLDGPRRISCNGDRSSAREVLAIRGI